MISTQIFNFLPKIIDAKLPKPPKYLVIFIVYQFSLKTNTNRSLNLQAHCVDWRNSRAAKARFYPEFISNLHSRPSAVEIFDFGNLIPKTVFSAVLHLHIQPRGVSSVFRSRFCLCVWRECRVWRVNAEGGQCEGSVNRKPSDPPAFTVNLV